MTEKERIEELAHNLYCKQDEYNMSNPFEIAKCVIDLGYRKIPEGSVVLTNDEWARLRNLEINYDDAYEAYLQYAIQNKELKEENGQLRLENNDLEAQVRQERKEKAKEEILKEVEGLLFPEEAYWPTWLVEIVDKCGVEDEEGKQIIDETRKEITKEIFQTINHLIIKDKTTPIWIKETIGEIAKQFGVEVEE